MDGLSCADISDEAVGAAPSGPGGEREVIIKQLVTLSGKTKS